MSAFITGQDDEIVGSSAASGDAIGHSTDELPHSGASVTATEDDEIA
jgi:hypothetical protein